MPSPSAPSGLTGTTSGRSPDNIIWWAAATCPECPRVWTRAGLVVDGDDTGGGIIVWVCGVPLPPKTVRRSFSTAEALRPSPASVPAVPWTRLNLQQIRNQLRGNLSTRTTHASDRHSVPCPAAFSLSSVKWTHPRGCPTGAKIESRLLATILNCDDFSFSSFDLTSLFLFWNNWTRKNGHPKIPKSVKHTSFKTSVLVCPSVCFTVSILSLTATNWPSMYSRPVINASLTAFSICFLIRPVAKGLIVLYKKLCLASRIENLSESTLTRTESTLKTEDLSRVAERRTMVD